MRHRRQHQKARAFELACPPAGHDVSTRGYPQSYIALCAKEFRVLGEKYNAAKGYKRQVVVLRFSNYLELFQIVRQPIPDADEKLFTLQPFTISHVEKIIAAYVAAQL
jgi:hypothetical protein